MTNKINDNSTDAPGGLAVWRRCALFVISGAIVLCGLTAVRNSQAGGELDLAAAENFVVEAENQDADFSRFKHSNPIHNRLPCLLCHKRDDNSATPKFSGHQPCSGCHTQQFNEGNKSPLCTICHTATGVKRFPGLKSFGARFDHAGHTKQANCATCHKPARRGVSFSIPSGANAHASCYQCHTASSGNTLSSCGLCHQPGRVAPVSDWAKSYTVNFSHARHLENQNCTACHTIRAGAARGRQVSAPLASMHFAPRGAQSCASCHNNRRTFGGEDFNDCKRCHTGNSFRFR
jgi:c(7)-type cytochrome triheme protein